MRRGPVLWLLAALGALLVAEALLVLVVLRSPEGGGDVRTGVLATREFLLGDGKSRGLFERVGAGVGGAGRALVDLLAGARDTPDRRPGKFARCVACHEDYAGKRRFTATYLDHAQHAELGVACATCHVDTAHPDPEAPREQVCAECHDVEQRRGCDSCHPPGALPHFYRSGFPRDGPVACDSCHRRGAFTSDEGGVALPEVDPSQERTCAGCHEAQTCASCHEAHPPDWVGTHGDAVLDDGGTSCAECHDMTATCTECHTDRARMDALSQEAP